MTVEVPAVLQAQPFLRDVLGLYSSEARQTSLNNELRLNVEMILNYLGLRMEYQDIDQGLPADQEMRKYRAVVYWQNSSKMKDAEKFWTWLADQLAAGRKVILLNGPGPLVESANGVSIPLPVINKTLGRMGLELGSRSSDFAVDATILFKDTLVAGFERQPEPRKVPFRQVISTRADNRIHLKIALSSTGQVSDAVVTGPSGAVALQGYAGYMDPLNFKRQWIINPFEFFSQGLGVEDSPRPDCTTINGRRIFYSNIDGDGFGNLSLVDPNFLSAEIIFDRILRAYPQYPFTVSVITSEIDMDYFGSLRKRKTAQRIFNLDNVEAASHTFSHPIVWNTSLISGQALTEYTKAFSDKTPSNGALLAYSIPGYVYNPAREIVFSSKYIQDKLLPAGKECRVLQWSGNCLPDEKALRTCSESGILNLNGGDSRFDGIYPSYMHLSPLYRQVGPYYQVFSSNSNENLYTYLWTRDFGRYQNVIQTYKNTESPRRVSPINVYYHFYSGERPASVYALKTIYDWVGAQPVIPVYASRYVKTVNGFISTRIEKNGENGWTVSGYGDCRTMRFDNCLLYPDLKSSAGVLGFRHYQGGLYIFLDQRENSRIVLTPEKPGSAYLYESDAELTNLAGTIGKEWNFDSFCHAKGDYVWLNLPANRLYRITAYNGSRRTSIDRVSGSGGRLDFRIPLNGRSKITVSAVR